MAFLADGKIEKNIDNYERPKSRRTPEPIT